MFTWQAKFRESDLPSFVPHFNPSYNLSKMTSTLFVTECAVQVGTVQSSVEDRFDSSRVPRRARRRTLAEELLADDQFLQRARRVHSQVEARRRVREDRLRKLGGRRKARMRRLAARQRALRLTDEWHSPHSGLTSLRMLRSSLCLRMHQSCVTFARLMHSNYRSFTLNVYFSLAPPTQPISLSRLWIWIWIYALIYLIWFLFCKKMRPKFVLLQNCTSDPIILEPLVDFEFPLGFFVHPVLDMSFEFSRHSCWIFKTPSDHSHHSKINLDLATFHIKTRGRLLVPLFYNV